MAATSGQGNQNRPARDLEIVKLRARGETLRAIASRFGLSRERVRQILELRGAGGAVRADLPADSRAARSLRLADQQRDSVVARWRRGEPVAVIAHELGLSTRVVRALLAREASEVDNAARRVALNQRSRAGRTHYSNADLIAAVRHVGATLGRPPSAAEYVELARRARLPSLSLIQVRIGWSAALRSAGLGAAAGKSKPHRQRWSQEACWAAVTQVAERVGHVPSIREYARASRGDPALPSAATVSQRLGGWAAVRLRLVDR